MCCYRIAVNESNSYSTGPYLIDIICGSVAVALLFMYNDFLTLFHHVLRYLRTLHIVWSQERRRVSRRLTRLQTMCNVLNIVIGY